MSLLFDLIIPNPLSLYQAIQKGDLKKVKKLIQKTALRENKDCFEIALKVAVESNNLSIVQTLIDAGSNVNAAIDEDNNSCFLFAVKKKYWPIAHYLISNGANINFSNKYGQNALMQLIRFSSYIESKEVNLLLEKGLNLNMQDINGDTALIYATKYVTSGIFGLPEIYKILIDNGSDLEISNKEGKTALEYAKDIHLIKFLLNNGARLGIPGILTSLINKLLDKFDPGNFDIVDLLIEYIDITEFRHTYGSLLKIKNLERLYIVAAYHGCKNIIKLTFALGVNVNAVAVPYYGNSYGGFDGSSMTALIAVIDGYGFENKKRRAIVEYLLKNGADINQQIWDYGNTALMNACEKANEEIATLLINNGADVNIKGFKGRYARLSAYDIVKEKNKYPPSQSEAEIFRRIANYIESRLLKP